MSEKRYLECDQCNHRDDISSDRIGGHRRHWVTVTKPMGESSEPIETGVQTFCSDQCLVKYAKSLVFKL